MAQPRTDDEQILQKLWPGISADYYGLSMYDSLLRHVKGRLSAVGQNSNITPDEILLIIEEVRRLKDAEQGELLRCVKDKISHKSPSDEDVSKVTRLAIYLWLTVDIKIPPASGIAPYVLPWDIQWGSNRSLSEQLSLSFLHPTNGALNYGNATGRLDKLTMAKLVERHALTIEWTSNLAEHLVLESQSDRRYLKVYEHKICLRNHLKYLNETALPREILVEAIDTLNLLFPDGDRPTKSLLGKRDKSFYDLATLGQPRVLDTCGYKYWRGRIEVLNRVLDEPLSGRKQFGFGRDGGNALQAATFWIATFVALFTIVSFALGVVSAVYAQKAYDIALVQYQLSLAQACAVPDTARLLPRFCS